MKSKLYALIAILILAAFTLTACEVSASEPPADDSGSVTVPEPEATQDPMAQLSQFATETAIAQQGGQPTSEVPADATPDPLASIPTLPPADGGEQPAVDSTAMPEPTTDTSVPVQPAQPVERPGTYTLKAGEFPYCIARRYNVNPDELLAINGLSNGNLFQVGLVLTIPTSNKTFPGNAALKAHPAQYTVMSGDTIYTVACKFGDVTPENIAAVNGLGSPFTLTAGQVIQIP